MKRETSKEPSYAGNPHVRFDEGEVAPCTAEASLRRVHCRRQPEGRASVCAATPRRGSLLYKKTIAFLGAATALALGAATPSSVPAWIDINAQIPARTDMSTDTVAFTTSADGRTIDEETGGIWTLVTFQPGMMLIIR